MKKRYIIALLVIAALFGGSWFDGHSAAAKPPPIRKAFPSKKHPSDLREFLRHFVNQRRG